MSGDDKVDVAMILGPKKAEEKADGYEAEALASDLISAIEASKPKEVVSSIKALIAACGGK